MYKRRKQILSGKTVRIKTGCGHLYVTLNEDNGVPSEIFLRLGKSGGCTAAFLEAITRICTLNLSTNRIVREIKEKIEKLITTKPENQEVEKIQLQLDDIMKNIKEIEDDLSIEEISKTFRNVLCPSPGLDNGMTIKSCIDGVGIALAKILGKDVKTTEIEDDLQESKMLKRKEE